MTIKALSTLAIATLLFCAGAAHAFNCGPGPTGIRSIEASAISGEVPSDGSSPTESVSGWDLSERSVVHCYGKPNQSRNAELYFEFRQPQRGDNYTYNGRDYLALNEYIGLAAEIWIEGNLKKHVPVRRDGVATSNMLTQVRTADSNGLLVVGNIGTGSEGRLYVHIREPFIGKTVLNRVEIAALHMGLSSDAIGEQPFAKVFVSGSLTSSSSCAFDQEVYQVDFGDMIGSAITPMAESGERYAKDLNISLRCTGPITSKGVSLSLEATPVRNMPTLIATNLQGIGIKTVANGKVISPLPDANTIPTAEQRIATTGSGKGTRSANVSFIPVRTEPKFEVGQINTSTTLVVEFE